MEYQKESNYKKVIGFFKFTLLAMTVMATSVLYFMK
jgi:hypothetical protein